jgi:hypothetical protein
MVPQRPGSSSGFAFLSKLLQFVDPDYGEQPFSNAVANWRGSRR